jgi:hypothetical protein
VAAALGALRDDRVGSGRGCSCRLRHGRHHVQNFGSCLVRLGEELGERLIDFGPSGRHDRWTRGQDRGPFGVACHEHQKVEAERPIGPVPDGGGQLGDLFGWAAAATLDAEPTGVRDRGDEIWVGPQTHPTEHDRMGDAERLADGSCQHVDRVTSWCERRILCGS